MKVTIYLYANKYIYDAILVADNKKQTIKRIGQKHKGKNIMQNYTIAALKALRALKFPVDIHIISPKSSFKMLPDIEEKIPKQDFVAENIGKWKEISDLIKKHKSYKANKHKDNEKINKKWHYYRKSMVTSKDNQNLDKMDRLFKEI